MQVRLFEQKTLEISIQYLNDSKGNVQAVQLPLSEWEKVLLKIKKYEQTLRIKSDLVEAFLEVEKIRAGKIKKETLADFLNEL